MIKKNPSSKSTQNTGSPQSGEPVFLTIGKLQRTHGVKGEILMDIMTDFPEKIAPGKSVFVGIQHKECMIASARQAGEKMLISFTGFSDCDQVAIFRNQFVYIKTEEATTLPAGEFYHHEIINMQVFDESEKIIGSVKEILITGANDVYVILNPDGDEKLIPAIRSVVLSIDRQSRKMVVRLPEWD